MPDHVAEQGDNYCKKIEQVNSNYENVNNIASCVKAFEISRWTVEFLKQDAEEYKKHDNECNFKLKRWFIDVKSIDHDDVVKTN